VQLLSRVEVAHDELAVHRDHVGGYGGLVDDVRTRQFTLELISGLFVDLVAGGELLEQCNAVVYGRSG
jgi:hypothetical protein